MLKLFAGQKLFIRVDPGQDAIECFQNDDLAAQTVPNAAQFQTDVSATDDHQPFGNIGKGQRGGAVSNTIIVLIDTAKRCGPAASANQDSIGLWRDTESLRAARMPAFP